RALGIPDEGLASLSDRLGGADSTEHYLIVLDNFEHVMAAAPDVSQILTAAPCLTLIVTSRSVLNLNGEHVFDVPPLALPSDETISLGNLQHVAAVRLFAERASAATREFSFTAETAPAVVSICRKLEGLPLAIELAARRLRVLGLPDLLVRLEHRLDVLTDGARDLPDRQHTLRSNIAWSVDLLEPAAAAIFRQAAVFRGGWTLDAASAV